MPWNYTERCLLKSIVLWCVLPCMHWSFVSISISIFGITFKNERNFVTHIFHFTISVVHPSESNWFGSVDMRCAFYLKHLPFNTYIIWIYFWILQQTLPLAISRSRPLFGYNVRFNSDFLNILFMLKCCLLHFVQFQSKIQIKLRNVMAST